MLVVIFVVVIVIIGGVSAMNSKPAIKKAKPPVLKLINDKNVSSTLRTDISSTPVVNEESENSTVNEESENSTVNEEHKTKYKTDPTQMFEIEGQEHDVLIPPSSIFSS
jgi:hypothetical protein